MSFEKPSLPEIIDDLLIRVFRRFIYKKYVDSFGLKGNEKVLELGCGGGNLSRFIIEKLSKGFLTCTDISKYWLIKAKKRLRKYENIEFKLGDVTKLKFKDSYYGMVVIHYVLHDIKENMRAKTLEILKKKLKKGGKFYIREPARKRHGMKPEEIKRLMKLAGLKEIYSKNEFSLLQGSMFVGVFMK